MTELHWIVFLLAPFFYCIEATDCQDGWVAYEGSCYLFGHDLISFSRAVNVCASHSAVVVRVEEAEENSFLKQFLQDFKLSDYWIGMTDSQVEGTWKWYSTELQVEYFDWGPGEPQDAHNEDCAVFGDTIGYTWADVDCGSNRKPVCEKVNDLVSVIG